jgi:hypothetical protein
VTTTTTAYLAVAQNLPRYQAMTAAEPAVKSATAYYEANIGGVASIKGLVGNYRLLSYALDAYGLGDQINNTAFATAFNFAGKGASSISAEYEGPGRWGVESEQSRQHLGRLGMEGRLQGGALG